MEKHITCHWLSKDNPLLLPACDNTLRILFLCNGSIRSGDIALCEQAVYIPDPTQPLSLNADTDSLILEILQFLTHEEFQQCRLAQYPYLLSYKDAPTYTEDCKSEKTISRMLVPQRMVPRFAMGSVQTKGEDLVAPHCHKDVDQFFYALPENNCILLIDQQQYPFTGDILFHIPLGSTHGILLESQHTCHYLWIDYLLNDDALTYMDNAHNMQGGQL